MIMAFRSGRALGRKDIEALAHDRRRVAHIAKPRLIRRQVDDQGDTQYRDLEHGIELPRLHDLSGRMRQRARNDFRRQHGCERRRGFVLAHEGVNMVIDGKSGGSGALVSSDEIEVNHVSAGRKRGSLPNSILKPSLPSSGFIQRSVTPLDFATG